MISAKILDAGTSPIKNPVLLGPFPPGMDGLVYREIDFEEDNVDPRPAEINDAMRAVEDVSIRPWPEELPGQSWIDKTRRYETDGDDGFRLNLYRHDRTSGTYAPVPAGEITLELNEPRETNEQAARITRELTWEEIQNRATTPADWLRLNVENRKSTGTDLENPLSIQWRGLRGTEYRLEMPDQSLFAPFDFRYPERYQGMTDDGVLLDPNETAGRLSLFAGGRYRLYFRPRKWRYVATVIAHYLLISAFELVPFSEVFTRANTQRPPFYPIRHDLIHTSKIKTIPNFYGDLRSWDAGINWQWEHTRSAAAIAHEIIDSQYWTKLLVKLFVGNEDADVTITRYPPDPDDIVFGIGRIDTATGRESRTWIVQRAELVDQYPRIVLGQYLVPFAVTPEPPISFF